MIEGLKVVTAREMSRIEGMALAEGALEVDYMENAGKAIADIVEDFVEKHDFDKVVTLLVGKGNNGGDAYAAGRRLLERGFLVVDYHLYSLDACGPLCKAMYEKFKREGGQIQFVRKEADFTFSPQGVILDGLVGTGFKGAAEGALAEIIEAANDSMLPIIAIDIPSGASGNTGAVETVAIEATITIYLGLPKLGFFLGKGWDHVGALIYASFGLKQECIDDAKPAAYLVNLDSLADIMPKIHRTRHKYEAGYVLGVAGSPGMPGAALLSSFATLKTGAGIVRLFHPHGMEGELNHAPYEVIREGWDGKDSSRIHEEMKRAKALFMGPGMGRSKETKRMISHLLPKITVPVVLDADALFYLSENPSTELPEQCILTPHRKEMEQLLAGWKKRKKESDFFADCQAYAEDKMITLVLKGAPTWIFSPKTPPLIVTAGDPGMATAGSGDVLTGMIAAMLAQGLEPVKAALLAVALHGLAGEYAAMNLTSYCMTASDLIEYLHDAFLHVLS